MFFIEEIMAQKDLGKSFKKDINTYKSLRKKTFSPDVYRRTGELDERAEKYFALFMEGNLDVSDLQKTFALYIDTFGGYKKEDMLDKLQAQCEFNVREHIEYASLSVWQKISGQKKEEIPYLTAKQLDKRRKFFMLASERISHNWYGNMSLHGKLDKLRREEENYVQAFLQGKVVIKPEDYSAFKAYIQTLEFDYYAGSNADKALQKLAKLRENAPLHTHTPEKKNFWAEKWGELKDKVSNIFNNTAKVIKNSFAIQKQTHTAASKSLWRKLKYAATISVLLLTTLSLNNSRGNSDLPSGEGKVGVKQNKAKKQAVPKTNNTAFTAPVSAKGQRKSAVADSLQNKYRQISKNFYDETITHFVSIGERDAMYAKVAKQVEQGVFALPEDISVERTVYSMIMYKQYGVKSSVGQALQAGSKLSDAAQKQLIADIRAAGETGLGVKKMAAKQHGKLSHYSVLNCKSAKQQQKHAQNLQELHKIRKAMAKANSNR